MLCFQEMAALEHKAMVLSGKHWYGLVMMYQFAKALCAQSKCHDFGVTKRKPKLLQQMLIFENKKASFFFPPLQFKYFLFSLVQLGFGLEVFLQRRLFFLQCNLTLPFVALHCREEIFFNTDVYILFCRQQQLIILSCNSYLNFFRCVSLSKNDKDQWIKQVA